jgi:hypothetical protein
MFADVFSRLICNSRSPVRIRVLALLSMNHLQQNAGTLQKSAYHLLTIPEVQNDPQTSSTINEEPDFIEAHFHALTLVRPQKGFQKLSGILRRTKQVRGLQQASEFFGRDDCHRFVTSAGDQRCLAGRDNVLDQTGEPFPGGTVRRRLHDSWTIFLYKSVLQPPAHGS